MPPTPSKQQNPPIWTIPPWKWFFSLNVGLTILVALLVASIAGTLIPDSQPGAGDSLRRAQAMVYYTWWYQLLLLLLTVNLTCATVRNLTEKTLPMLRLRFIRASNFYVNKPRGSFRFEGEAAEVARALAKRGFRAASDGPLGSASKGNWSLFGAPTAHLGMVIVLLGGFAAGWVSREGMVSMFEGGIATAMNSTDPNARNFINTGKPLGFTLRCDDFDIGFHPNTDPPMPSRYVTTVTSLDADPPVITERVEVNRSVKVNAWMLHQTGYTQVPGLKRYALSLFEAGASAPVSIELSPGQKRLLPGRAEIEISLGEAYPYPWALRDRGRAIAEGALFTGSQKLVLTVDRFEPDFSMGQSRQIGSRSRELNNPAAHVLITEAGEIVADAWLFSRADLKEMMGSMMQREGAGYDLDLVEVSGQDPNYRLRISVKRASDQAPLGVFELGVGEEISIGEDSATEIEEEAEPSPDSAPWKVETTGSVPAYRTDLTMTRNPAVPVIYAGCGLMMLGLLMAFGNRRKEIWFRVNAPAKELQVAGRYRYPRETLDAGTLRALEDVCGPGARLSDEKAE